MADHASELDGTIRSWCAPRVDPPLRLLSGSTAPPLVEHGERVIEVVIQPQESTFAATLFGLIPTPRAGRRFAGVYRQIKTGLAQDALPRFEGSGEATGEYQVPMLLLAILIGAPAAARRLFPALQEAVAHGRDLRALLFDCAAIAPDMASLSMVQEIIRPIVADPRFPATPILFHLWLPRIDRYSFDMTGAPRCSWQPPAERSVRPGLAGQSALH